MPFLGQTPPSQFSSIAKQSITGNGGATYTLDYSVTNSNELEVYVNNVRQEPGVAYTATGTSIVFSEAIASTDSVYVVYQGRSIGSVAPSASSVNSQQIVDGAVGTTKLAMYQANVLIVAGGGSGGAGGSGGGAGAGGGGGGGGVIEATIQVTSGTSYTITVGSGGAATLSSAGSQGNNSSISDIVPNLIAIGGGYGHGATVSGNTYAGGSGGSGGGSANWNVAANTFTPGGVGTGSQGFQAGYAQGTSGGNRTGSGGGGAGGPGGNSIVGTVVGWGGPGKASYISGTLTYYGGGGGGSTDNPGGGGAGGVGGGGAGSNTTTATSGSANTGGGGGGSLPGFSGAGGSGIVIISYANSTQRALGGTITSYTSNSTKYWVHTFTSSSTFTA